MKTSLITLTAFLSLSAWSQDPFFKDQWGLKNEGQKIFREENEIYKKEFIGIKGIDANWPGQDVINALPKDREVVVAVIDTGMDMNHPEFKGRLYLGKDFLDDTAMLDDVGHGTHVAGIIAANVDGSGIEGITPSSVKILPLKVLNKNTTAFVYKGKVITDIIANALAYAIEAKVAVINMSLGWPQLINTPKIVRALDLAAEQGIVLVAAAGNNNKDVPTWPCAHPAVICVAAMDNQGLLTEFSNHGGKVDLAAPGEWIVSTIPRSLESRTLRIQGYEAKNGSSQAAPFVAAAAALLKLQNPNFTARDIKARLYASAKKMRADRDQRFIRFGSLSIKDALNMQEPSLASVLVKELMSVGVNEKGEFDFTLPLEILSSSTSIPKVSIEGIDATVTLLDKKIRLQGQLKDMNQDSEVSVTFKVTLDGFETQTMTTLSFARKLKAADLISIKIPGIKAQAMLSMQGALKSSRMGQVSVEDKPTHDLHGFIQAKKDDQFKITSIKINMTQNTAETVDMLLEDHSQVLSFFEKDVNFDGVMDLVFYGMNAKRTHLLLTFKSADGKPLFGAHSRWELPISTFEGLPLKDGEMVDFNWIKSKTFLGEILVPYYQKDWLMPDQDNSSNLLDHEENTVDTRLYYWEPVKEGDRTIVTPRVIDSVAFKKTLRKKLKAGPRESVKVERILPQTFKEKAIGTNRHLLSIGDGFQRRFSVMTVDYVGHQTLVDHADQDIFQSGNNGLSTRSLDDFSISANSFQMALLDKANARVKPFVNGEAVMAWPLKTSGWGNPFFEVVDTFESENRRVLFFESRYHVYVYDQLDNKSPVTHRLPINRDSSFPGVNFSETLQAVIVKDGHINQPAVAVNSTLIYGDRLYSMVSRGESFTRPVSLSVNVPANCVPVKSQFVTTSLLHSSYAMICQENDGVSMNFFPLKLN